jgi:hypothetical protein
MFKHYWVLIALVLTTLSLAVLLLHMPSVSTLAGLARRADDAAASRLGGDILHPALGLLVLIVITVLNVHNPAASPRTGNTSKQLEPKGSSTKNAPPLDSWLKIQHRGPRRWAAQQRRMSRRETGLRKAFVLGPSLRGC